MNLIDSYDHFVSCESNSSLCNKMCVLRKIFGVVCLSVLTKIIVLKWTNHTNRYRLKNVSATSEKRLVYKTMHEHATKMLIIISENHQGECLVE